MCCAGSESVAAQRPSGKVLRHVPVKSLTARPRIRERICFESDNNEITGLRALENLRICCRITSCNVCLSVLIQI